MIRIIGVYVSFLIFGCCFFECSSNGTVRKDAFSETALSVYVRIETLDIPETATDDDLRKLMVDKGLLRYRTLMSALGNDTDKNDYIASLLKNEPKYRIVYIHEYEYFAESLIDFETPPDIYKIYRDKYPVIMKKDNDD